MPSSAARRHCYYRYGKRISDDEAVDSRGALLNGVSFRVPMFLRDGRPNPSLTPLQRDVASRRAPITDAVGSTNFSRPGYRVMNDAAVRDARETAYQQYQDELVNAWKTPHKAWRRDHD
jgi:hypothetical protein